MLEKGTRRLVGSHCVAKSWQTVAGFDQNREAPGKKSPPEALEIATFDGGLPSTIPPRHCYIAPFPTPSTRNNRLTRRILIAGNWKMNTRQECGAALARQIVEQVGENPTVDVALCPPAVYLTAVADAVAGTPVGLGAQNLHPAEDGAFTGEVNAAMLTDVGCRYVILGHSERRAIFGETDAMIREKLQAALAGNLIPIVCVGETLEDREAGNTEKVVETQLRGSLAGLDDVRAAGIVVAYEPVWAIGTGKTASPEQAEEVHAFLRKLLGDMFRTEIADQIRIQYGGSVKPGNAKELLGQPNIDGALVGGASLKAEDFIGIIEPA